MKIGELVKVSGFVVLCICFYEVSGLFELVCCQVNGYWEYGLEVLMWFVIIDCVQCVGFLFDEICVVLLFDFGVWLYDELLVVLWYKVDEIVLFEWCFVQNWQYFEMLIDEIENKFEGEDCVGVVQWMFDWLCEQVSQLLEFVFVVWLVCKCV